MDDIQKYFEIKCKKCGSTDVDISQHDQYDSNEDYCGFNVSITCMNCNETFYISERKLQWI